MICLNVKKEKEFFPVFTFRLLCETSSIDDPLSFTFELKVHCRINLKVSIIIFTGKVIVYREKGCLHP